jgi:hypothetical protein
VRIRDAQRDRHPDWNGLDRSIGTSGRSWRRGLGHGFGPWLRRRPGQNAKYSVVAVADGMEATPRVQAVTSNTQESEAADLRREFGWAATDP